MLQKARLICMHAELALDINLQIYSAFPWDFFLNMTNLNNILLARGLIILVTLYKN